MTHSLPTAVPMAIIGLSGRYPGGATTIGALWQNLIDGVDAIVDAPAGRWDRGYLQPDASTDRDGRSYIFKGGFLESIDGFDAEFFGLSPREAAQVDPQHRLLLELAWEALEDAAIVPRSLAGSRTGVFVGLSNPDYGQLCATPQANAYTNTGSALSIASNRISYVLDLRGPSMTIDTACSSGLVSVHQACRALAAGDCEMALVGAANMLISPLPWVGFAKASMLSPAGRCKSFDADGQGYVRAEGGGMLLLKPLAAAEREGNTILGVILGTAVNSDGRTLGMSMPSVDAQEAVLRQAYRAAGVAPQHVTYVEAHGTGTSVGDPIECEALGRVLGSARTDGSTLAIGSIKSNIGHLEPASGIAGITKLLLAMRHRRMPANLHFNTPNPRIDFAGWKLKVVAEHLPLPASGEPLLFGINSFGFGGTNAHAVLREYRSAKPVGTPVAPVTVRLGDDAPLLLSAHNAAGLSATARRWITFLRDSDRAQWGAIRASAARCRTLHPQRLALRADDPTEAADALERHIAGETLPALATGRAPAAPKLAFVYSGNGPQWWAMGRELLNQEPRFAAAVKAVDREFRALAGWSLIDELRSDEARSRMALTEVAQPCLFALQVALTTVLADVGITPDAVIGHSVGEAAAAHASGALDLAQATAVIYHRSTTQARTAGLGRMAALGVSAADARAAIARVGGFVELAAVNAPRAVTVAGAPEALQALCQMLTDEGRFARMLTLDYPFHTRAMDGIRADLLARLDGLAPGAAVRPFISTVEGRAIEGHELGADYWWRNVREPVRFAEGVDALLQQHATTTFVEIGPHPVLREYVAQCITERSSAAVALQTLRRPTPTKAQSDVENLQAAILACHAHGVAQTAQVFQRPAHPLRLPEYPWQRTPHWRGKVGLPDVAPASEREHPLLGWRAGHAEGSWDNLLDTTLLPWLDDHRVQDAAVFPAAGYLEMALAAAASVHGREAVIDIEDLDLLKPMVLSPTSAAIVSCQLDTQDGTIDIRTRSGPLASDAVTDHAHGRISAAGSAERPPAADFAALRVAHPVEIGRAAHYRETARRGLHYGPAFQAVHSLRLTKPGAARRGLIAEIELPEQLLADLPAFRNHPSLFDAALQTIVSLLAQNESSAAACIPVRVGRLRSFAPLPARFIGQGLLTKDGPRSGLADLVIWDMDGQALLTAHDIRFDKVDFQSRGTTPLLTEQWRPDPSGAGLKPLPIELPAPGAVVGALGETIARIVEQHRRDDHCARVEARIDRAVGARAAEALAALGIGDAPFTLSRLQRRAGVPSAQLPLLQRLIAMAVEDGWLQARGDGWQRAADSAQPDAAEAWRAAWAASPACNAELIQLARVGDALPAILRGATPSPEPLADTAPFHACCAQLAAGVVDALVGRWPSGRTIRVLEMGGDAGSTLTTSLMPLMPPQRSVYTYADADSAAIDRVLQRHGSGGVLRGLPLNLDTATPESLAADSGAHDVIVHTAGLHRSADAALALTRARQLLAPGGWLVIVEPRPQRLLELLYGQHDGWWRHGRSPLRSAADWSDALTALGFDAPVIVAADRDRDAQQSLLLAQKPLDAPAPSLATSPTAAAKAARSSWLLLADASSTGQRFAQAVAAALDQRGQQARTHTVTATTTPADLAAPVALGAAQIVHLAGLTANGDGDPAALQALRTGTLLRLVQALEADTQASVDVKPRLQIVTRGAFASPTGGGPLQPAQAPVWGLARVLMNEYAELAPKLIDLHTTLDDAGAARLADELLRDDAETEVMLDNSQRLLCRLQVNSLQALDAMAARNAPREGGWRLGPGAQAGLDQMAIARAERRTPQAGEVEIAVRSAGLNFRDVLWTMGVLPDEAVEHGFAGAVIGMECAGEIVAVGPDVHELQLGDHVIGFASGCFASHVTTRAGAVVRMPHGMGFDEAATIPTAFMTALYALDHLARLEPGERVLIHGAAGGVGLAAVQIAKRRGAIVYGTAGSDDKRRMLRLLGVDAVLNSRSLAFADDVMALTAGRGVDVVLNSLAGEAITKNLQILAPYGRLLEIGKRDLYANSRIGLRPFRNNLSYFGIDVDTLQIERPALARRLLLDLMQMFEIGQLQPLPYQAMPVTRAAHAFRLMQQSRHVGKLVLTMPTSGVAPADTEAPRLRRDGSYLVTGGLGGFGLATARWLVGQGAGAVALMSRSGATTDEARQGIDAMRAAGATVTAYAADVTNHDDVARVLADIRATLPPLRGVVHAAMVLDDAPLLQLDAERLERVLAPKIRGAWHLHQQTAVDPLDLFVMYSSATTTIGNPGQGNYVAANMFLESLAERRRAEGRPALAVGWGAIQDVGVVTRHAGLEQLIASRSGMQAIPSAQALAELGRLLAVDATRVSPTRFDPHRLAATGLAGARTPRCAVLAPQNLREADGAARETLADRLARMPAESHHAAIADAVYGHLGRILGTGAAQINPQQALSDMGLDSLMAVELASALERETGQPVSVMRMIQAGSSQAIVELLADAMRKAPQAA